MLLTGSMKSWSREKTWHSLILWYKMMVKNLMVLMLNCQMQFLISRFTNILSKVIFTRQMKDIQLQRSRITLRTTLWNFVVHCATTGLEISTEHWNAKEPLIKSLYRFHVYYHVRCILKRIVVPTPSEEGFDRHNNSYDLKEVRCIGDWIWL